MDFNMIFGGFLVHTKIIKLLWKMFGYKNIAAKLALANLSMCVQYWQSNIYILDLPFFFNISFIYIVFPFFWSEKEILISGWKNTKCISVYIVNKICIKFCWRFWIRNFFASLYFLKGSFIFLQLQFFINIHSWAMM